MEIALIETHHDGHHISYLRAIVDSLSKNNNLILLSTESVAARYSAHKAGAHIETYLLPRLPSYKNLRCLLASWAVFNIRTLALLSTKLRAIENERNAKFDFVIFPTLYDNSFAGFSYTRWIFPWHIGGIYMNSLFFRRGQTEYSKQQVIRQPYFLKDPRMKLIGILDSGIAPGVSSYSRQAIAVTLPDFPEAVAPEPPSTAAEVLLRAGGRPIILLTGFLKKSKGVITFCELSKNYIHEAFFILVGELHAGDFTDVEIASIRALNSQKNGNFMFISGYIEKDAWLHWYIYISSVLYIAYENFYNSSNQLSLALLYEKAAIVPFGGCMAHQASQNRSVKVVDPSDQSSLTRAINDILATTATDAEQEKKISPNKEGRSRFIETLSSAVSDLAN